MTIPLKQNIVNVEYCNFTFYQKELPNKGRSIFTIDAIKKDEVVIIGKPMIKLKQRTWLSLQMNEDSHVHMDYPFSAVNHSCNPNCGLQNNEFGGYNLVALRDIVPHQEIVFDYAMSEWECVAIKKCLCNALDCRENAIGAQSVEPHVLHKYLPYLSNYILQKVTENET